MLLILRVCFGISSNHSPLPLRVWVTARLVPVQFHTWRLIGPRCHSEQLGPGCQRRVEESAEKFATLFSFQRYLDFLTGTNNKN